MLSEYATKNMQLERDVTALHKELECLRDMNEVRLKENEDEIIKLRRELELCYESSEEAARDTDRLRGELSALSTAYSNLEEEYNRLLSLNPAGAPVGVFDGAEAGGRQPEGEVSSQGHAGSEVEDLRAENARLRIDARAADEVSPTRISAQTNRNKNLIGADDSGCSLPIREWVRLVLRILSCYKK